MKSYFLKLAQDLEDKYASMDTDDEKLLQSFASALNTVNKLAAEYETNPVDDLHCIAALAAAFDASGDEELQKEADALDEILFAIASPKSAIAGINAVYDAELEELRSARRSKDLEQKYKGSVEALDELHQKKRIADAVKDQVKVRRPLQEPLSTRYSPDRPGVQMLRITDGVYQDPITGKIYDYAAGYTTDKGVDVPGSAVEHQTHGESERQPRSVFTTREGLLSTASVKTASANAFFNVFKGYDMIGPLFDDFLEGLKMWNHLFLIEEGYENQADVNEKAAQGDTYAQQILKASEIFNKKVNLIQGALSSIRSEIDSLDEEEFSSI